MKIPQSSIMNFLSSMLLLFAVAFSQKSFAQYDLIVAQDGTGNYTTVQAAINAAPTGRNTPFVIFIKNGTYKEKITVPATKPFIKLQGENVARVILTYDDYAAKLTSCTNTVGTQNSASFSINANDFSAVNVTFVNSFGDGSQAVTVLVNADRAIFLNCRFLGNQDTLYLKGSGAPRNYFKNCYIDGNVDFIFGSAIALFDSCVVVAKSRTTAGTSYITAPNTPLGQSYGFVFRDARLPRNTGNTQYFLSRPWPSPDLANTRQKTVFLSSKMSNHIKPEGWSTWDANTITANLYYAEYNSRYFNNAVVDISQRVPWSYQLNSTDSSSYTQSNLFGTWNPCNTVPELCTPVVTNLAVSNFKGVKGISSSQFSWNISWPLEGIQYTLYKSTDGASFSPVYTNFEATDSVINFSYTDASIPASGSAWYYYLTTSQAGYETQSTDTVIISSLSELTVNASVALNYCGFSQLLGSPSATQTYQLSGNNLTANVLVTPPVPFEVSADNANWYTSTSPLVIVPVSGTVSQQTLYLRLNATAVGNYGGDVLNATSGVATYAFPITGVTYAASTSFPLQEWPLTINNSDSTSVRSPAVLPSSSTLFNLYTSDASQPAAAPIPAYSGQYGQALGANTTGNGWSNIGSTLKRNFYEQFTVTAASGSQIRVDSVTFLSDFYNTISGIKMAVAYSKNGFSSPADSSEFFSGTGPGGVTLTFAASGSFSKSFTLQRNDAGPINRYSLSLNGVDGVTLNSGETLTIRLYWACGSSSIPRFAFLKDVVVKGVVLSPVPMRLVDFKAQHQASKNLLQWQTQNESMMSRIEVEKSVNGFDFNKIGILPAYNKEFNFYNFTDNKVWLIQYYRLKLIDADDHYDFSPVKKITVKDPVSMPIIPNPVTDVCAVNHLQASSSAVIKIFDSNGKLLLLKKVNQGSSQTLLNINQFAAGNYSLIYQDGNVVNSASLIKQNK